MLLQELNGPQVSLAQPRFEEIVKRMAPLASLSSNQEPIFYDPPVVSSLPT